MKKKTQFVVGHITNKTIRRRWFSTENAASRYIGNVIEKRDPQGVLRGDYYVDKVRR